MSISGNPRTRSQMRLLHGRTCNSSLDSRLRGNDNEVAFPMQSLTR